MSYETEGKLIEKFDTVEVSDKFKKREFVIETSSNANGSIYTENIKFQLVQNNIEKLDYSNVNDMIKVKFNIKGRKWEKDGKTSYFNSLDAWFIEKLGDSQPKGETLEAVIPETDVEDDLPF